jgi:hypothetical protein
MWSSFALINLYLDLYLSPGCIPVSLGLKLLRLILRFHPGTARSELDERERVENCARKHAAATWSAKVS